MAPMQTLKEAQDDFAALIREHQRMIYSLCYRMTGSAADAEDLAQETFIKAYQHLGEFQGRAQFSSWLYRIAVNRCLNWQKSARRQLELRREWAETAQSSAGPDTALAAQVEAALLELKPAQRVAVVLTVYDGLNHAEAARILGCSETTVSWRVFVARRKLKRRLKHLKSSSHEQP